MNGVKSGHLKNWPWSKVAVRFHSLISSVLIDVKHHFLFDRFCVRVLDIRFEW